ncbi:MAG TPA: response regulator transcription factor [Solirubrobacterales bacterium]|nr:response regulator transcription factor [Solirubrobacterales bacterium]
MISPIVQTDNQASTDLARPSLGRLGLADGERTFVGALAAEAERVGVRTFRLDHDQLTTAALKQAKFDAILLDRSTVGDTFWDRLELICAEIPSLSVLVCSERCDLASRLRGLRTGADDWITKPAAVTEVFARIEASCRPRRAPRLRYSVLARAGELEIRPQTLEVLVAGIRLELTRREFELLYFFAVESERVLEREAIYRRVWGYAMANGDRSVDTYVGRLRLKLEDASPGWAYIHTHFGIGYRFEPRPLAEAAQPQRLATRLRPPGPTLVQGG